MDENQDKRLLGAKRALSLEIEQSVEVKLVVEIAAVLEHVLSLYFPRQRAGATRALTRLRGASSSHFFLPNAGLTPNYRL
jgi:hypothetical protein